MGWFRNSIVDADGKALAEGDMVVILCEYPRPNEWNPQGHRGEVVRIKSAKYIEVFVTDLGGSTTVAAHEVRQV